MILDAMLTANEVAELSGLSQRHIRRLAQGGRLSYEMSETSSGRPQYLFPLNGLAALDPDLPQKYLKPAAERPRGQRKAAAQRRRAHTI